MSRTKTYPFYAAYTQLHDLFGIDLPTDKFETIGLSGWEWINNKDVVMYKAKIYPHEDCHGHFIAEVPCNCDIIEAITTNYEDFQRTSAIKNFPGTYSASTESFIEAGKYDTQDVYQSGRLVNYRRVGDLLYFTEPYPELNLLYKGIYADEDGLPFLNAKEVDAIATYCAYSTFRKKALASMDGNTYKMAADLNNEWLKKCTQARVPDYIDQNEMNAILDAKTSWDRKCYNKTFKPVN